MGCGRIASKPQLVRLATVASGSGSPATLVIDLERKLPGRGAYVCREQSTDAPVADCLSHALTRKTLARAFRRAVTVPAEIVESVG